MSDLVGRGSKYSDEDRREAAVQYAVTGSVSATSRAMSIPRKTISDWKQTDWWDEVVAKVRHEKADEHIARYQTLTNKALKAAERGIDELEDKELSANDIKALVITGATATDKGLLLDGKPTSIKGNSDSMEMLTRKFEWISDNSVWNPETSRYELRGSIAGEFKEIDSAQNHANFQASIVSVQKDDTE